MIKESIIATGVYSFGCDAKHHLEDKNIAEYLGGKGAGLVIMSELDIPVPPGFTISSEICKYYYQNNHTLPPHIDDLINKNILKIEQKLFSYFGNTKSPLIISVRSGARISMPGMMDTILNLGLNDQTVLGLAETSGDKRFALDCYRRLIQMYGSVVMKVESSQFEEVIDLKKFEKKYKHDQELNIPDLEYLIKRFKEIIRTETGQDFPNDVRKQLSESIKAVFESWTSHRAITYRRINNIKDDFGTAVTIQAMVFGNYDTKSGTGVIFSRNPVNGDNKLFGEYLPQAQGEDIVAGIRTPLSIENAVSKAIIPPQIYAELEQIAKKLESYFSDIQDIEFTIQQNKLWVLQTRSAKRTVSAAIKIAVDLAKEGIISQEQAINRIDANSLSQILHPTINQNHSYKIFTKGLAASPGAATGVVVFSADEAERRSLSENVILVRNETCPEDIHGMHAAQGILTCKGGMTSHAAVVARGMGKCCICGASDIVVDYEAKTITNNSIKINEGDVITLNGNTGEVIIGTVETTQPNLSDEFKTLIEWAHKYKKMSVRANSETVIDTLTAKDFGAQGIGLCRTEHMFFDSSRINIMREMILASNSLERKSSLSKLLAIQVRDFEEILKIMAPLPVNIRLLDPPLNEFISDNPKEIGLLATALGISIEKVKSKVNELMEHNPMLGHRGCRLGITYPEIYNMQTTAIFTAIKNLIAQDYQPSVEIMIPLIISDHELKTLRSDIELTATKLNIASEYYKIGTMIELPRACLIAEKIVQYADYFSFGTNDLTQTTLGISRDDCSNFMTKYIDKNIFKVDPFVELDTEGVGELMKTALNKARSVKPEIKTSVCGEHAGNPNSISFFNQIGINYISCSPYRLPIAILAAAQAALKEV
jgi:pyruvate,orthophosphate dikinase